MFYILLLKCEVKYWESSFYHVRKSDKSADTDLMYDGHRLNNLLL